MLLTFAEYFLQINFISLDALSRNTLAKLGRSRLKMKEVTAFQFDVNGKMTPCSLLRYKIQRSA